MGSLASRFAPARPQIGPHFVAFIFRVCGATIIAAGLGFLIAGAIGNAFDRIRLGAVIEFIDASKIGFVWVFNVADTSVDIGIGLLLLASPLPRRAQVTMS